MKWYTKLFTAPYLYILVISIGIFLKFYKVEQQFFWDDEIATILHTSGIPMSVYGQQIPVNQIIHRKYFDDILKLNSRNLKISDQIIGLTKMPQLTPGHYYYLIFITRIFGDSYKVYRYFSVFVYLLSALFLFLLVKKLYNSTPAALIALSLYAISPFFQAYAQEARYYILWAAAIIIMHYLFLLALEKGKTVWWIIYAIAGFFAVHITIMFYVTLIAHFIYCIICYRKFWKPLVISQFAIFLSSVPWLIYISINYSEIYQSLEWQKTSALVFNSIWEVFFTHFNQFINLFFNSNVSFLSANFQLIIHILLSILLVVAIILFFKKAENKQKWFVALITFLGVLIIAAMDLIRSSGSSNLPRYLLVNFVGIIILCSYSIQKAIEKKPILFGSIFLVIVVLSITSSLETANDLADGNRFDSNYHVKDAREKLWGKERILILSDFTVIGSGSYSAMMSLIHASKNENIDIIYANTPYPNYREIVPFEKYDKVYCMYASANLTKQLSTEFSGKEFSLLEKRIMYGIFDVSVYALQPGIK